MGAHLPTNDESQMSTTLRKKSATRAYINDMLIELCIMAKNSEQEDLYLLLKLTSQAARDSIPSKP